MPVCHKCKWNDASIEEKQAHCPTCKYEELSSCGDFSLDEKEWSHEYVSLHVADLEHADIIKELGKQDNQVKLILDFVAKVCELDLLDRLLIFALIDCGGADNGKLVEATGVSRQTIIQHRRRLEADEYWKGFMRLARIKKRQERPNRQKGKKSNSNMKGLPVSLLEKWDGKRIDFDESQKIKAEENKKEKAKFKRIKQAIKEYKEGKRKEV